MKSIFKLFIIKNKIIKIFAQFFSFLGTFRNYKSSSKVFVTFKISNCSQVISLPIGKSSLNRNRKLEEPECGCFYTHQNASEHRKSVGVSSFNDNEARF